MSIANSASRAAAIHEQMAEVAAVFISGCPDTDYNGEFQRVQDTDMEGRPCWPRYQNMRGKNLFYLDAASEWVIQDEILENFGRGDVYHRAPGGMLPTGTEMWSCRLLSSLITPEEDAPPPTEPPPPVDPPGLDRDDARSWCKRGVRARHPNGNVGEVTMNPDGDSEVKIRFADGDVSSYVSIHALEYVGQSSANAADDRPAVGDRVRLREGWESVGDASGGPLRPGDEGTILEDDGSTCPFYIEAESGKNWWYKPAAIEKVVARVGCSVEASGTASLESAANLALRPFALPEQATHAAHAVTLVALSARDVEIRDTCMLNAYSGKGDTCMLDVYHGGIAPKTTNPQTETCMLELYAGVDQGVVMRYGIDRSFSSRVAEIFGYYADGQTLNKIGYKHFLQAVSYWGNNKDCTDDRYDECGWPQECKMLECDPEVGISSWAFENRLYARCRKSLLATDLEAVRRHQAKVRGEAPANFDEQGELPPHWRTKIDQSRKKRYYYTACEQLAQEPGDAPLSRVGRPTWVRPEAGNVGDLGQGSRRSNVSPLVCMSGGDGNVTMRDSTVHFTGSFPTVGQEEDTFSAGVSFYEVR